MAKEAKESNSVKAVVGIFGLVLIGVVLFKVFDTQKTANQVYGTNPTSNTTTVANTSAPVTAETPVSSKIEIKNTSFADKGYGIRGILGEVTNHDSIKHTLILKATFYDANGKIVGTATGSVSDLAPNETKTFEAYTTDNIDSYKTFKVQLDSSF